MDTIYGKMFDIPCRIAYPQIGWTDEDIAKRQAKRKGKAKAYKDKKTNVTLLIPKSDKKTFKRIMQQLLDVSGLDSVEEITQHPFINKDGDWRDGSDPEYADKAGFVGNLFCKVGSNKPVAMEMVDSKGNRVEVPFEKAKDVFYPGANCVVIVQAAAMDGDDEGDVNVAFYLKAIMRLDDKAPRLDGDSAATTALFQGYAASGA